MTSAGFVIPTAPQFDFRVTVFSHGWLMLAPFSWDGDSGALQYVYQTDSGAVQRLLMREAADGVRVDLPDCRSPSPQMEAEFSLAAKRILNIDWDLCAFYAAMRAHEGYDWLETERKGRILISPNLWEDLVKVLLTTNCAWAQSVNMSRRLRRLGAARPSLEDCQAFPSPGSIAAMDVDELAAAARAGYRSAYLHDLARKIAEGEIDLDAWLALDSDGLFKAVKSLKGFGDYAAGTIARMYGHFDKVAIDTACRAMYAARHNGGVKGGDKEIQAHYQRFGRWRGLVMWMDVMRHYGD